MCELVNVRVLVLGFVGFFNVVIQESNKLKKIDFFFNAKHVCWLLGASKDEMIEDKSRSQDNEKSKVSRELRTEGREIVETGIITS